MREVTPPPQPVSHRLLGLSHSPRHPRPPILLCSRGVPFGCDPGPWWHIGDWLGGGDDTTCPESNSGPLAVLHPLRADEDATELLETAGCQGVHPVAQNTITEECE